MLYPSPIALIGNTPLVELRHIQIPNNNRIFAKLESFNPAGGMKDRVALHILSHLKNEGKIHKNSLIVEATAGNTGLGIAFVCLHFGIRALLVVPDKFSIEKQTLMRALGAEIVTTPNKEGMQGAIKKAQKILESNPNALSLNQFENPLNPQAHYLNTAREIYNDMGNLANIDQENANRESAINSFLNASHDCARKEVDMYCGNFESDYSGDKHAAQLPQHPSSTTNPKKIYGEKAMLSATTNNQMQTRKTHTCKRKKTLPRLDYFVAGAGSGGSFSGVAQYLKEQDSRIKAILCDPIGSILGGGKEGCANIEGIGNNFIPKTLDTSLIDGVEKISDEEAYIGVRKLAKTEGLLAGISSGACLEACLKLAGKVQDSLIVTIFADDLSRYFSRNLM